MRQGNFPGTRNDTSANQARIGDGVVRRTIRTGSHQSSSRVQNSSDAVDFRGFKCFFRGERWQDGRHALGQHRLTRSGRPDHQDVVSPGTGDFDRTLRRLLSTNVFEVDQELLRLAQKRVSICFDWSDSIAGVHEVDHIEERSHRVNVHASHHRGFLRISLGHDQPRNLSPSCLKRYGQSPSHSANASVQRKLTDEKAIRNVLLCQPSVGADDAESHGQVEARALLLNIRGGKIDGGYESAECRIQFFSAARTRSRLSRTAASGNPTVWK